MIVIVTGGRDFSDADAVRAALHPLFERGSVLLVHGGARGLDRLAHDVALAWNRYLFRPDYQRVSVKVFLADWRRYGLFGGPKRNREMAVFARDHEDADKRCMRFRGGKGTANCAAEAAAVGISVTVIE